MAPHESAFQDELEDLDRRNWGLWALNGLLLITMAVVITSLYLPQVWGVIGADIIAPETRGVLVSGLCGLVLIFMLYMLLKQREISKLRGSIERQGLTLVPLSIYFNASGRAKVELALARGKKAHDKRDTIKERDWKREQQRLMKQR